MRRFAVITAGLVSTIALSIGGVAARAAASRGTWGTAREVPGTAALNAGGFADTRSVSCPSAGNCSAGGLYTDSSGGRQAFVVAEKNGIWGTAREVPGTAALNKGGGAELHSVSCTSAGNCSGGGDYTDSSGNTQVFIVIEENGIWGAAEEVPGSAALNTGGSAEIDSVSCGAAGNCSAGGSYADSSGHDHAFVVSEKNGTWRTARKVPGAARITSVFCASAGNCSAGGSASGQAFVIGETDGTWGTAEEVPGIAALGKNGAILQSVSCASAGNCSAGGVYIDGAFSQQVFVVSEKNNTWRTAREVPGTAALNKGGFADFGSVSCSSAGNCSAGGSYADGSDNNQAFVVNKTSGTWRTAREVPGTAALNKGGQAGIAAVSCTSAGNCNAGGNYAHSPASEQAFVVGETNGTWGTAEEVPGIAALNTGGLAGIGTMSCASVANCSAGGQYLDSAFNGQAFVVKKT
jgi:hypothetical protein